jgi:hypothetical protein
MPRRLLFAGLLNALLLCGWGGVFAALMCPHAAARAAEAALHECCRARLTHKAAQPTSTHCHARADEPDGAHEAHDGAQRSPDDAHIQDGAAASHGAEHGAQSSQPSRGAEQVSRPSHVTAHAAREGRAGGGLVREGPRAARAVQSSAGCAHCVGQPEQPNAPAKARGGEGSRREQSRPAPHDQAPNGFSPASFAPSVIPVQGSPPGTSRLHVLLNVFLI